MLDDLPNLDELEMQKQPMNTGMSMIPPSEVNRYQKFIRNSGVSTPKQSGMNVEKNQPPNQGQIFQQKMQAPQYQPYEPKRVYENFDMDIPFMHNQRNHPIKIKIPRYENEYPHGHGHFHHHENKNLKQTYSCIDIADHTSNCAVCSKLYSNNNTIYIFIIIFQAVVLLLLLKRILETDK